MPCKPPGYSGDLAQTLRNIDQKLPLLTRDQQNLIASYTRGLADGLALRREGARFSATANQPLRKKR